MLLKLQTSKKRKICLALAVVATTVYVAGQLAVLRPMRIKVREKTRELTRKGGDLRRRGWPLEHEQLTILLAQLSRKREISELRRGAVLSRAGIPFRDRILRRYETPEHFQRQVTRLDYQEEFKRLETYLDEQDIKITRRTFKLSEDTTGVDNYKLVLQLWTIRAVVETALANGLRVVDAPVAADHPPDAPPPPRASDVGALAIVPYLPFAHIEAPYLLRVPMRLRLRGDSGQLHAFLMSAGAGEVFFTVDHMQLRKPVPPKVDYDNAQIEAEFECSTFYILDSESGRQMMARPQPQPLPRGA